MSVDHDSIKANDLLVEGKRLHDAGKYEEAVASFDKAIEIDPKNAATWMSKGIVLGRFLKRNDDAIVCYDKSIEHEFEITNLGKAFARDFELPTSRYVEYILRFGEFFEKNDVSDKIGISHYVEIINKIHALKKLGILESEKKRLLQGAKDKTLPPHKEYREDLNKLTKT